MNLGNIQVVLGCRGLRSKVSPIRSGALRNQTIIRQTSGPSLSRLSYQIGGSTDWTRSAKITDSLNFGDHHQMFGDKRDMGGSDLHSSLSLIYIRVS